MSRRATRDVHRRVKKRGYYPDGETRAGCGLACLMALLAALSFVGCVHGPTPEDQADLQIVAITVSHAAACIPPEESAASMQALGRLGASLSSQEQARAIWRVGEAIVQAGAQWLGAWARPPP